MIIVYNWVSSTKSTRIYISQSLVFNFSLPLSIICCNLIGTYSTKFCKTVLKSFSQRLIILFKTESQKAKPLKYTSQASINHQFPIMLVPCDRGAHSSAGIKFGIFSLWHSYVLCDLYICYKISKNSKCWRTVLLTYSMIWIIKQTCFYKIATCTPSLFQTRYNCF